jgi:hypothetical protein
MRKGRIEKINWRKFRTEKFEWPVDVEISETECGAYALYALTKEPHDEIMKLSRNGHWPTRLMLKFLRDRGFQVVPVTLNNVVESYRFEQNKPELNKFNVLLLDQHAYEDQSTWSVAYDNMLGHSGYPEPIDALQFVNYPIQAAYLIFHKDWK